MTDSWESQEMENRAILLCFHCIKIQIGFPAAQEIKQPCRYVVSLRRCSSSSSAAAALQRNLTFFFL